VLQVVILVLAAVGHVVLWVALVNRAHALGIKRRWVNLMTLGCVAMCGVVPIAVLAAIVNVVWSQSSLFATMLYAVACTYLAACAIVCVVGAVQRLYWRFHSERKGVLTSNHTTRINLATRCAEPLLSPGVVTWLGRMPGNQILKVCVQYKELCLPRLAPEYAGIRIAHLTDLHMSGRMSRSFYEHIVEETNRCGPDIIAITGDIVDSDACLSWISDVLGQLRAPGGVLYVLGNHDRRVSQDGLKAALAATNWVHVAGKQHRVVTKGIELVFGGNERPWFGTPTDFATCSSDDAAGLPLRIGLSHSPDQIGWASTNDVDLMLAGHVHGGQICLPVIGPFTAPSMHGVRYAAGTFLVGNTILHVSRGAASLTPLRWFCPPEIAILELNAI
jgi:predicted MPP superfamily phosphohydrolase